MSVWIVIFGSSLTRGYLLFPFLIPFLPFFPLRGVLVSIGFLRHWSGRAIAPRHLRRSLSANRMPGTCGRALDLRLLHAPDECYEISELASVSAPSRERRRPEKFMKLPPFEYACPASLAEAVALLASHDGEAKPLAGGQSLVPMLAFRVAAPSLLVDLRKLTSCGRSRLRLTACALGAMVRWRDILERRHGCASAHPLSGGGRRARRALPDPQSRHCRRQPGACRSRLPNCRASSSPARRRSPFSAKPGPRVIEAADFFRGPLDDGAHVRRDHHRNSFSGVAGAPPFRLCRVRPPPRRLCAGGRGAVLRRG